MVPMTAPVTIFSWRAPVKPVMTIPAEASATAILSPRSSPIIMYVVMIKLLYKFMFGVGWW